MKTLNDVRGEIQSLLIIRQPEKINQVLKEWANEIVNECAGSFECTMEPDMDYVGGNSDGRDQYVQVGEHPVLVRQSVLDVKNKIK